MKILIIDRSSYPITSRVYTDEGFLKVSGHVARSGIQQYLAHELGLDGDPNRIVNVFRPPEEVFHKDSLDSFNGSDITDDHPDDLVNSKSFKHVVVGNVPGIGLQDGDFVEIPIIIKDETAIKNVEDGKVQLSAGYTAEYERIDGETKDGQKYEFIQRDIRINHVALVDKARAGAMARIFDKKPEAKKMAKVTLDNNRQVDVDDAVAAQVEDCIDRLTKKVTASEGRAEGLQAKFDSTSEELEKVKKASSDEAIKAKVAELAKTMDSAKKIAGKEFTSDSVDPTEIKRAALTLKNPKKGYSDKSAAYIDAAFEIEAEKETEDEEEEEEKNKKASDSQSQLAKDLAKKGKEQPTSARQKYNDRIMNAHKGEDA